MIGWAVPKLQARGAAQGMSDCQQLYPELARGSRGSLGAPRSWASILEQRWLGSFLSQG